MDNFNDVGRLTRDFEVRTINSGNKVIFVSSSAIAIPRVYKNKKGEYEADFIDIQVWGEGFATKIAPNLKKGNRVHVTGRLQTDRYVDKNGTNRTSFKINCSGCRNLESRNRDLSAKQGGEYAPQFTPANDFSAGDFSTGDFVPMNDDDDGIPF